MSTKAKHYTITETAKLSGLPESTLRYYETIGIIKPIKRDTNTGRRVYSDDDVNLVVAIACLNATGLSIEDMRAYLENSQQGEANAQVNLLKGQLEHLENDMHYAKLRIKYVKSKIEYWQAIAKQDDKAVELAGKTTYAIADQMRLPKSP